MSRHLPTRRAAAIASMSASVVLLTSPATAADPVTGSWTSQTDFGYSVQWMPDIDQRWWNLPGDGSMYCVPTSAMNMLAFAAHWGDQNLQPGPGVWDDNDTTEQWDLADDIELLGFLMNTDAEDGTGLSGLWTGLDLWIGTRPFDVIVEARTENDYPTLSDVAQYGASGGGCLVSIAFGRYDWTLVGNTPRLDARRGGHMVTVAHASRDGNDELLFVRDPAAADNNLFEQASYASRTYDGLWTRTIIADTNNDGAFSSVTATTLGTTGSGRLQVIDSLTVIAPTFAGGFSGGSVAFQPVGGLGFVDAGGQGGGLDLDIPLPEQAIPLDLVLDPDQLGALVLLMLPDGTPTLMHVARGRQAATPVMSLPAVPAALQVDRRGDVLLAIGREILRMEQASPTAPPVLVPVAVMDFIIGTMVIDDARDELLVFAESGPQAARLAIASPEPQPVGLLLPAVQAAREAARRTGAAGATDLRTVIVDSTDGGEVVRLLTFEEDGQPLLKVAVPADTSRRTTTATLDRRGRLVLCDADGSVRSFVETPAGWSQAADDWYADLAGLRHVAFSRSRTNVQPELHEGPGWENIDPSELDQDPGMLDCHADLDGDGQVGIHDLLLVQSDWMGSGIADIVPAPGGDGVVDFLDVLAVLGAWGPCP